METVRPQRPRLFHVQQWYTQCLREPLTTDN